MDDYTDWMKITAQEKQRKSGKFEERGEESDVLNLMCLI